MIGTSGAMRSSSAKTRPGQIAIRRCGVIVRIEIALLSAALCQMAAACTTGSGNQFFTAKMQARLKIELELLASGWSRPDHLAILVGRAKSRLEHERARRNLWNHGLHTRPIEILRAAMEAVAYRFALVASALEPFCARLQS